MLGCTKNRNCRGVNVKPSQTEMPVCVLSEGTVSVCGTAVEHEQLNNSTLLNKNTQ